MVDTFALQASVGLSATHVLMKPLIGVVMSDLPRYVASLALGDWRVVRNRRERLEMAPDGTGYRCDWQWTSDLHAPKVIPALGRQLMRRALTDHPMGHTDHLPHPDRAPQVSFLIGHRGMTRLPHLLVRSAASPRNRTPLWNASWWSRMLCRNSARACHLGCVWSTPRRLPRICPIADPGLLISVLSMPEARCWCYMTTTCWYPWTTQR